MFESLLFFLMGYIFARMIQPSLEAEMLLYWNKDCMAWRPLADKSEMKPGMRYLAAFEIQPAENQE